MPNPISMFAGSTQIEGPSGSLAEATARARSGAMANPGRRVPSGVPRGIAGDVRGQRWEACAMGEVRRRPEAFLDWAFVVALAALGASALGALAAFIVDHAITAADKRACRAAGHAVVAGKTDENEWRCVTAPERP